MRSSMQLLCHAFQCVTVLICFHAVTATAVATHGGGRQLGGSTLLSSRSARELQAPVSLLTQDAEPASDPDAEPVMTTGPPTTTTDVGKAMAREAQDIAWKTAGEATEARAATSKLRSRINRMGAETHSATAQKYGNLGTQVYAPKAARAEASAKALLVQALDSEKKVKDILATVDAEAFKAAQKAAIEEIVKLEEESKKYYMSLLAKFKALADPGPPTAADAAAKAAQPYIDVELRVGALVQYYNEKAVAELTNAQAAANQAQSIAATAQIEQKMGVVDMAQRHMMQAHMMVGQANMMKANAWNIRKLAESLNMSIPSYQRAAQQAAAHALATFTGLQMADKAHAEMRRKVSESTLLVEQAFKSLDATLAKTSKALETITLDL